MPVRIDDDAKALRDPSGLGCDVAMKVLRPEHVIRTEIVERFVEEMQIGGQLQHPGIVPGYEIGLQANERPCFAMALACDGLVGSRFSTDRMVGPRRFELPTSCTPSSSLARGSSVVPSTSSRNVLQLPADSRSLVTVLVTGAAVSPGSATLPFRST